MDIYLYYNIHLHNGCKVQFGLTRCGSYCNCWPDVGEKLRTRGKNPTTASSCYTNISDQLFIFFNTEPWYLNNSLLRLTLHSSPIGTSLYFIFFFIKLELSLERSSSIIPQYSISLDNVLPRTVLLSFSASRARNLTGSFLLVTSERWKVAYLLEIIVFR